MTSLTSFAMPHLLQMDVNDEARLGLYQLPNPGAMVLVYEQHPSWTLWQGVTPLASFGVVSPWPGLGELWAVVSLHARQTVRPVLEAMRGCLELTIIKQRLRRVHAAARKQALQSRRLLVAMGLHPCSVWPCYGPRGEAVVWYVLYPHK